MFRRSLHIRFPHLASGPILTPTSRSPRPRRLLPLKRIQRPRTLRHLPRKRRLPHTLQPVHARLVRLHPVCPHALLRAPHAVRLVWVRPGVLLLEEEVCLFAPHHVLEQHGPVSPEVVVWDRVPAGLEGIV